MDQPQYEPRPKCATHGITFRTWGGAQAHKLGKASKCRIVTVMVRTR